jgi:hypothetical protein
MVVICIYDESENIYTNCEPFGNSTYLADKDLWEEFIVGRTGTVRLGIIIPSNDEDRVRCPTEDWPFDSDRLEVDRLVVGVQDPRVLEQDILNIFETIRTTPDTIKDPQLLLFVLDNLGSIVLTDYADELAAAKVQLELDFPQYAYPRRHQQCR